jgi:hypothetical protein
MPRTLPFSCSRISSTLPGGFPGSAGSPDMFHAQTVEQAVGLGPGRTDRWSLAGVEPAELDAGGVDVFGHFAAQGIDFLDQVSFGQAADGRIAGHGADGVGVDDADQGAAAHSGRRQRGFAPGVSGADHGNIEFIHIFLAVAG